MTRNPRDEVLDRLGHVDTAAQLAIVMAWIIAIGGTLAGAGAAFITQDEGFSDTTHPYIGVGIVTIVGSLAIGAILSVLGHWAIAWALVTRRTPHVVWAPTPTPPPPGR